MESPGNNESREQATERMLKTFIEKHPEYAEKNFSADEIRQAAALIDTMEEAEISDEETLSEALEARLSVRPIAGKTPVINDRDEVLGMAASPEEARQILRDNAEEDRAS